MRCQQYLIENDKGLSIVFESKLFGSVLQEKKQWKQMNLEETDDNK